MDRKLEIAPLMRNNVEAKTLMSIDITDFDAVKEAIGMRLMPKQSASFTSLSMERRNRMILRERRLYEASVAGCVDSLNKLIQEDRLILHRPSVVCSDETPLHIAAMLGHVSFAKALLALKRDLSTERESRGHVPLHLASANGHLEMVKELVLLNPDTCLCQDEDGRTPLHLAMIKGRVDILKELYQARPEAAKFIENNGDSILHLGVKHNHLEAVQLFVEMTRDHNLVNAKDREGNTILHLAAAYKRIETVKYLLLRTGIEVNSVNVNNLTALDIVDYAPRDLKVIELKELLLNAGAKKAKHIPSSTPSSVKLINDNSSVVLDIEPMPPQLDVDPHVAMGRPLITPSGELRKQQQKLDAHEKWLKKKRDSLLVAATVIAAMAYQAGLSPPGGVWDNDYKDEHGNVLYWAGTSIMAANYPDGYTCFWKYNTVSFVASLSTIFLLISGLPIRKRRFMWILMATMWMTITFMALTYLESMKAILYLQNPEDTRPITRVVRNSMFVWLGFIGIVFLVHTIRCLVIVLKNMKNPDKLRKRLSGYVSWGWSDSMK